MKREDFKLVARRGGELTWFRPDLAAILVEAEEQERLDGLLDVEAERVVQDFPEVLGTVSTAKGQT